MKYSVFIGDREITLEHENFGNTINVDDLTTIDTSNIFGEHVTISAAVNRIGLMKSEVMATMAEARLEYKMYEGMYKARLRKQASKNKGMYSIRIDNEDVEVKLSEASLATSFETDEEWIKLKRAFIKAEKDFNALDALYWACQDKSRKLNGLVQGTTPEEYVDKMISGKVNGVLIKANHHE